MDDRQAADKMGGQIDETGKTGGELMRSEEHGGDWMRDPLVRLEGS